jgi:asparagine synthase (glutamine-hydrolysing)
MRSEAASARISRLLAMLAHMCGFVFAYSQAGNRLPDQSLLDRMDTAIRHRGPDAHGQQQTARAAMRHRRLAIIDLSGGRQPMSSADGQVWIVFNGEIYNFREVQDALAAAGQPVDTNSDTEVLLRAYLAWGEACVERLNGMFTFAIYDARTQSVFAARDRFGEKPLYILERDGTLFLASELKALVDGGLVDKRLDPMALYSYFTSGYVMGPRSIFRGVRRLQPGHWLKAAGTKLVEHRYWAPPAPSEQRADESAIVRELSDILLDSVRLRLVSDVPVGFFLSGGVDSSAVVALASEVSGQRLETFSIGFDEPRYDEREHARYVARRFGTRHHEFVLEPEGIEVIEQIAWHADEPFADAAALPTWYLSQLTRKHVTVSLSGDGGDEMFAGYDSYRGHVLSERLRKLPGWVRGAAVAALRALPGQDTGRRMACLRLARNIEDAGLAAGERFAAKQQVAFRREHLAAISPYLAPRATAENDREFFAPLFDPALPALGGMTLWQQTVSLADDMLVKVDRMSMAHSLEVRAPFLDHRLAELMNRVKFGTKLPGGRQKYLLRKAMERYLPPSFLWRRKQGFSVPLSHWFKDSLANYIGQRLLAPGAMVGHLFERAALERTIGEHARMARDWSQALWALLMFETWCRRYRIGPDSLRGG